MGLSSRIRFSFKPWDYHPERDIDTRSWDYHPERDIDIKPWDYHPERDIDIKPWDYHPEQDLDSKQILAVNKFILIRIVSRVTILIRQRDLLDVSQTSYDIHNLSPQACPPNCS